MVRIINSEECRFKHISNYNCNCDKSGEYNSKPSLTIPDDSYSIEELIANFSTSIPVKDGDYDLVVNDTSDVPTTLLDTIDNLEINEVHQRGFDIADLDMDAPRRVKLAKSKAEKEKAEADFNSKVDEKVKERLSQKNESVAEVK